MIDPNVVITAANHSLEVEHRREIELAKVVIEDNVWIGAGAIILSGVTIHQGAIVGANSLVKEDVPSNAIVGGTPAKTIKYTE